MYATVLKPFCLFYYKSYSSQSCGGQPNTTVLQEIPRDEGDKNEFGLNCFRRCDSAA